MVKINIDKYVGKCYHLGIKKFSVSYASMGTNVNIKLLLLSYFLQQKNLFHQPGKG